MLTFSVTLIAVFVVAIDCGTIKYKYAISQREKRSPYECRPEFGPPLPPPPPFPPFPPHHHHHHSEYNARAYSEANAEARQDYQLGNEPSYQNLGQGYRGQEYPGQGYLSQQYPEQGYQGQGYQGQNYQNQGQNYPVECDTCKDGKSTAISNAKSNTGNAVAVAVSKG